MIQAAGTLPVFLLAIPAGVLSDILDRRRFLIGIQIGLGGRERRPRCSWPGPARSRSTSLVALTFLGGVGAALVAPDLAVHRARARAASRTSRAPWRSTRSASTSPGPSARRSAASCWPPSEPPPSTALDVLSYVVVIAALLWWRREAGADDGLREHFGGALRAGLRYARASRELHRVLLRAAVFFAFASAVWALLPLVARQDDRRRRRASTA